MRKSISTFFPRLALPVLLLLFRIAEASTVQVPGDAATISDAISGAVSGDTIVVMPGTYSGAGNEGIRFNGKSLVIRSQAGASSTNLLTLDSARTFVLTTRGDSGIVIEGFTISGGVNFSSDSFNVSRGGIQVDNGHVTINDCLIRNCHAESGGGIYVGEEGRVALVNSEITDCIAIYRGGGLASEGEEVIVHDSRIRGNRTVHDFGGGIFVTGRLEARRSMVCQNKVLDRELGVGGGILGLGATIVLDSCTLSQNNASLGGGMVTLDGQTKVSNSIVYNNVSAEYAGLVNLITDFPSSEFTVEHCTFACNYSVRIATDGVAILGNAQPTESPIVKKVIAQRSGRNLISSGVHATASITSSIFAFQSSAGIGIYDNRISPEISFNVFWKNVAGSHFAGEVGSLIGLAGNIVADPLFCELSDTGLYLDVSSKCNTAGVSGMCAGARDARCNQFSDGPPRSYTIHANPNFGDNSRDSIQNVLNLARAWDTLNLVSREYYFYGEDIRITKPVYLRGRSQELTLLIGATIGDSTANVFDVRSFAVMEKLGAIGFTFFGGVTPIGINVTDCSPMISDCRLAADGNFASLEAAAVQANGTASPLIRNCHFDPGIAVSPTGVKTLGPLDVIAAWNFWESNDTTLIQESFISDGRTTPGLGIISFAPFLANTPTGADEEEELLPTVFELHQNYPNPFNPVTTISFTLSRPGAAHVEISNILGQKVCSWNFERLGQGVHEIAWNGMDQHGQSVATGIYFYQVRALGESAVKKMVLVK